MDYIVLKKEAAAFRAVHITRSSRPPLAKTENSFTLTAKIEPQIHGIMGTGIPNKFTYL